MKKGVLNHKYFLYITSFFAGMSIMAVELGASRLLAPYFSSSQIVWTIIIGTIMIALAIGNVIGGRMADKDSNPDRFYKRLLVSAVWIAAIPFLGRYVIALISGALAIFVKSNFLIWASLVSCIVIFVFPLILLGTATPSLVKYTVESLDNNGKNSWWFRCSKHYRKYYRNIFTYIFNYSYGRHFSYFYYFFSSFIDYRSYLFY